MLTQEYIAMQKITPFLWFDDQAEEAVDFYITLFRNSGILSVARYDEAGARASGRPEGTVMTIEFRLEGQVFIALNGGPAFTFSPAVSFLVDCETQEEVDALWEKLSTDGEVQQCGWLTDKYGMTWQIVPGVLRKMLQDPDAEKSKHVMEAMLKQVKLDIKTLEDAYGR